VLVPELLDRPEDMAEGLPDRNMVFTCLTLFWSQSSFLRPKSQPEVQPADDTGSFLTSPEGLELPATRDIAAQRADVTLVKCNSSVLGQEKAHVLLF